MAQSSPRHSVSVAAAIINQDGQLLAVRRRDNGHWEPPGGVLELDETIQAGLVREVLEETGLRVEPEVETSGLDVSEHGMWGYPEFYIPVPGGYGTEAHSHLLAHRREFPPREDEEEVAEAA